MLEDTSWECDNCKTGGGHYSYVISTLNKMAEYSNLNTGESKTRNI